MAPSPDAQKPGKDPAASADGKTASDAAALPEMDTSSIGLGTLFQWATTWDKWLYAVGGVNAACFGFSQPAIAYVLGEIFNNAVIKPPEELAEDMQALLWIFAIIISSAVH